MAPRLWGYWTRSKLEILERYLDSFTTASKRSPETLYIDAFAGQPDNVDRLTGDSIPGSAEIALRVNSRPFDVLQFFEMPDNAQKLEAYLRDEFPDREFNVVAGDSNTELPRSLVDLRTSIGNWRPAFAFIDPNATEANWELLRALADFKAGRPYKVELFYLFSPQMFQRLLRIDASQVREEDRDTITRVFGTSDWERIYDAKISEEIAASDATLEYLNLMRWRLENVLGYRWTHPIEMKNEAGSPIYYMIFATDHEAGDRIMRNLFAAAAVEHPKMREDARRLRRALEEAPATLFEADELLALEAPIEEGERFYEHEPPTLPWWYDEV